jgi:hypothetical protein
MLHVRALVHIKAINHQLNAQYALLYSPLILLRPTCFNPAGLSSGRTVIYIQSCFNEHVPLTSQSVVSERVLANGRRLTAYIIRRREMAINGIECDICSRSIRINLPPRKLR